MTGFGMKTRQTRLAYAKVYSLFLLFFNSLILLINRTVGLHASHMRASRVCRASFAPAGALLRYLICALLRTGSEEVSV